MLEIAVWLTLLFIIVAIAIFVALTRHYQKIAGLELRNLSRTLRQIQSERREFDARARHYSLRDPEPYQSRSASLKKTQSEIHKQIEELETKRVRINEQTTRLKKMGVRSFFVAPFSWRSVGSEAVLLEVEASNIQSRLDRIAQMESELQKLPWLVAQQARQLCPHLQDVSQTLTRLNQIGLQGDTFQTAAARVDQIQTVVAQIPGQFFENDETFLLKEASKETVAQVHKILTSNQSGLDELEKQLKGWEISASASVNKVAELRQLIDKVEQTMSNLPSQLDISEEKASLRQIKVIAQNLQASANRLEVETIPKVLAEAEQVHQSAQDQMTRLSRSVSELAALEALQSELSIGFRDASLRLATLTAHSTHPIRVDASLEKLIRLNRVSNSVANGLARRTLQGLSQDLQTLVDISTQQKDLFQKIKKIETSQAALSNLLETPQFKRLSKWIHETRALVEDMADYSPENWSRLDDIANFGKSVELFAAEAERLVTQNHGQPIPEQELDERLKQIDQLFQEYHRLASRAEIFSQRINELHTLEQHSQETLDDQRKFLNQVRLIAKSNPFLADVGLDEIERFLKSTLAVQVDLEKPGQGSVEKKARQASDQAVRIEAAAFRWLDLLNKECQARLKGLSASLNQLDAIARLEDPSLAEARRLLASEEALRSANPSQRGPAGTDELVLAVKRRSNLWQECGVAKKSMENVEQLIETHQEADSMRQQARQQINEFAGSNPRKRTWPPTSVTFEVELSELDQLDREWIGLRERTGKAIFMVAQYSNLGSRYQNLFQRLPKIASQRDQEQKIVEALDDEILELARSWENLLIQYQEYPEASNEIREMLENLNRALKDLERGYLRGEIDYDDVVQEMKTIQRRVRYFQIALDDEHALDVSGRVSRRR